MKTTKQTIWERKGGKLVIAGHTKAPPARYLVAHRLEKDWCGGVRVIGKTFRYERVEGLTRRQYKQRRKTGWRRNEKPPVDGRDARAFPERGAVDFGGDAMSKRDWFGTVMTGAGCLVLMLVVVALLFVGSALAA